MVEGGTREHVRPCRADSCRGSVDPLGSRTSSWQTLKGAGGWSLGPEWNVVVLMLGDLVLGAFRARLEKGWV